MVLLVYHSYFSLTTPHSMIKKHTHKQKIHKYIKNEKLFIYQINNNKNVRK